MTTNDIEREAFTLEGKALGAVKLRSGDLLLEGWAARFNEIDREGELFDSAAFERSARSFFAGTATLLFHHIKAKPIGRVLSLERRDEGLWMSAIVDGALKDDPELRTIYHQVKSGTIRGASVGGFFHRVKSAAGPRISAVDLTEISLTSLPVGGHSTIVSVTAEGKAMRDMHPELAVLLADIDALRLTVARDRLRALAAA